MLIQPFSIVYLGVLHSLSEVCHVKVWIKLGYPDFISSLSSLYQQNLYAQWETGKISDKTGLSKVYQALMGHGEGC